MQRQLVDTLLIEIGGTHTRCAVGGPDDAPVQIALFKNADFAGLESVVGAYLDRFPGAPPRRAALAVAAPVDRQPLRLRLTNLDWPVETGALAARFGWSDAVQINDFEALACALPAFGADELFQIRGGEAVPDMPLAVLGPGTGLGVSGLVPGAGGWHPFSGEGGHVTLAAADDREAEILGRLRREFGHVSAERVLCGPGLLLLHRVVAGGEAAASPDEVTRLAGRGDAGAVETLELFFRFLATVASDLALTIGALGGVYLGGGILPGIRERLTASGFADRFVDKGRFHDYLKDVPVHLILAETPALRGIMRHPRVRADWE